MINIIIAIISIFINYDYYQTWVIGKALNKSGKIYGNLINLNKFKLIRCKMGKTLVSGFFPDEMGNTY